MTDQLAAIHEGRAERTAFWTGHLEELAQSTLPQRAYAAKRNRSF